MRRYVILGFLSVFAFAANAQSDWINIATTSDKEQTYEIKKGSGELSETKGGTEIYVVIGRVIQNDKSKKISLGRYYVSTHDCKRKEGMLVALKISKEFDFETPFVFGGGNISSAMAESICYGYEYVVENSRKKGI